MLGPRQTGRLNFAPGRFFFKTRKIEFKIKRAPNLPKDHLMVVNLSGRGDKDMQTIVHHMEQQEKHA